MRRGGYSLAELILAVFLIALLGGLGVLNMRSGIASADAHAVAMLVAEQLRLARQSAITTQQPVAVILPTDNGSQAASQSLYLATGLSMAHVARVVSFGRDFPPVLVCPGPWPLTGGGSFSTFPSLAGQRGRAFAVNPWLVNPNLPAYNMQKDFALVFTPDGGVVSNGVPFSQGAYTLVAAVGGTFTATSQPTAATAGSNSTLSYFSPTALGKPWTILVSPSGMVRIEAGLTGQDGTVAMAEQCSLPPLATPPPVPPLPASNAVVNATTVNPAPPLTLPPGANVTIAAGQRLTLTVNATDSSGRDLYCQWTSTAGTVSGASGRFSLPGPERMAWDPLAQVWTSSWDWMCPLGAQPGDHFSFACSLGGSLSAMVTMASNPQTVQAVRPDKIRMLTLATYEGLQAIYLVRWNFDGSSPIYTVFDYNPAHIYATPTFSADGSKFMVTQWAGGPTPTLSVYSADTGRLISTAPMPGAPGGGNSYVGLNPAGNKAAWYWTPTPWDSPHDVWISNLDGTGNQAIFTNAIEDGGWLRSLQWSPDGSQVAFLRIDPAWLPAITSGIGPYRLGQELTVINVTTNTGTNQTFSTAPGTTPIVSQWLAWSGDSQSVYLVPDPFDPAMIAVPQGLYQYSVATNSLANSGNPISATPDGVTWPYAVTADGAFIIYLGPGGNLCASPGAVPLAKAPAFMSMPYFGVTRQ